ncbi:MAG: PIN domain-containing protein [Syntrophomonadaceae bacterium]
MKNRFISWQLILAGILAGLWGSHSLRVYFDLGIAGQIGAGMLVCLLFYLSGKLVLGILSRGIIILNRWLDNTSIEVLLCGSAGLIAGALVGLLSSYPLSVMRGAGNYLTIITFVLCGYLGMKIGSRRAAEVWRMLPSQLTEPELTAERYDDFNKILDTSAIIDGRIYDVCQSKFLEGTLMVPVFVIEELQHIADSSDNLRRSKGRRGLDLLSKMQKDAAINIRIIDCDISAEKEVDMKLVRLCKRLHASIITNDYNLNKVAELHGIKVLNINELTNAVKVVVYPGETMYINILKEGKEPGQGVGYLEDGTMVVVEDAQAEIGNNLEVIVTSVFQTAAGRMIFSRRIREERSAGIGKTSLSGEAVREVNMYG